MVDRNKTKVNCITFAPFLKELNGHVMDYHASLHKLFKGNGWETTTLLSQDCPLENLPENWKKNLHSPVKWSRRSFFAKLLPLLFNISSVIKMTQSFFKTIRPLIQKEKGHKTVLFLETFNTFHLYALAFILPFLPIKNVYLWILYRYDSKQLFFKGKKDRKILKRIEHILMKKRLSLFADTDSLAEELSSFFDRKVHLLPIPHTSGVTQVEHNLDIKRPLCFWWPGVPRRPKGLHLIQKLTSFQSAQNRAVILRVSEKTAGLSDLCMFGIEKISENLVRKDYLSYLMSSDAILMPYNIWNYRYSSSGIFIEAVVANKVPIVSPGLWISEELKKHDLASLIVDFDDPKILSLIVDLVLNEDIRAKLKLMSQAYREFHNEKNFAKRLFNHI